jgi:SAM-dependent methyltransferase
MSNAYTDGHYLERNPTWHVEDSVWKAQKVIRLIAPIILKLQFGMTVAEVGCGAGGVIAEVVRILHERGYLVTRAAGYDISPQAIAIAKKQHGNHIEYLLQDFVQIEEKFDLGLIIDVIEHLEDPASFLKALASRFHLVVLHIPLDDNLEFRWRNKQAEHHETVGHLHSFNKLSALALLGHSGLEPLSWMYTSASIDLLRLHGTWKSYFAVVPRKSLFLINSDLAVRVFGHFSLMVVCRSSASGANR